MSFATVLRLSALTIVLTVVGSLILLQFDWFGDAASTAADPIDTLFDVMVVLSTFVFSIVLVMFGYAIWKYRARPGDESDGEPIHGNTKLEIAWTLIPTIIVLFGAGYSWVVLDDVEAQADDQMRLNITAQQFKWTFEYPEVEVGQTSEGEPQYLTTDELHVPVDRQLMINLRSLDVIHSFWVPEWRIKRDAVPIGNSGDEVDDEFVVTPTEEGTYSLVCTELCGVGHATMRAVVVVESQEDFERWVAEQRQEAEGEGGQPGGGGTGANGGDEGGESGGDTGNGGEGA